MHGFLKFNHFITLVFVSAFLLFSPRIFADVPVGHIFAVSPLKIEYISQKPNVSLLNITAIVQDDEDFFLDDILGIDSLNSGPILTKIVLYVM